MGGIGSGEVMQGDKCEVRVYLGESMGEHSGMTIGIPSGLIH